MTTFLLYGQKINNCIDCGIDISHKGNRSKRCDSCQKDYTNKRRRLRRKNKFIDNPRICEDCGTGIQYYPSNALYCKYCIKKHKKSADHNWYLNNKEQHAKACSDYYILHKEEILLAHRKKHPKKKHLLTKEQKNILLHIKAEHSKYIRGTHDKANGTLSVLAQFLTYIDRMEDTFRTANFGKKRKYSECPITQHECIQALIFGHKKGIVDKKYISTRGVTWKFNNQMVPIINGGIP